MVEEESKTEALHIPRSPPAPMSLWRHLVTSSTIVPVDSRELLGEFNKAIKMELELEGSKVVTGVPTLLWKKYKIWKDYIWMDL